MSDYTYGLHTLAEYTARAEQEVRRLEQLQEERLTDDRVYEINSAATQAGITIWHLTDFAFNGSDQASVGARLGGIFAAVLSETLEQARRMNDVPSL